MAVTIHDVARKLSLSITTVSRALDGYDDVAKDTQELVVRTAREMGYTPNRAARQLRRKKADAVGFILPPSAQRISEPFFMEFIAGLGDELASNGQDLLMANAASDENERELYQRWIGGRKVDGIILNRVMVHDWRVGFLHDHEVPFATLERSLDDYDYPSIQVDAGDGYNRLLSHLAGNGFKKFGYIGGPTTLVNHVHRREWIKQAARNVGLELLPAREQTANLTSMGGYQAARTLLADPERPDAILCIDDETAFGALHAAHERHLKVGREIAIAGFDGTAESLHTEPPMTTLDIPVYDIARDLVRMVTARINDRLEKDARRKIQPELVMRASTGPAVRSKNTVKP